MNKDVVGRSAADIAARAGTRDPENRAHHPAAGRRRGNRRPSGKGKALPGRRHPALQDLRGGGRPKPRRTCWSKARVTRRHCTRNDEVAHPLSPGVELPISRLVVNQPSVADRRRLTDQRVRADHDARLRLLGRQLDLGEPRLQASDERLADRQGDHGQEGSNGRRNLGLNNLDRVLLQDSRRDGSDALGGAHRTNGVSARQ